MSISRIVAVFVIHIFLAPTTLFAEQISLTGKQLHDPYSRDTIQSAMRRAADYQITTQASTQDNGWIRAAFYTGVMATYQATKDEKYLNQAIQWSEAAKWTPPPQPQPYRHADNLCCGQTYAELYLLKKEPHMLAPLRGIVDRMISEPLAGRVDWWWCDALFMAPPMLVRLSAATDDAKYRLLMNDMFWDTHEFLYDKDEHLFYRDATFFNARTQNGKKVFWSRGNGWVMGGIARVLQYLPANDPTRPRYVQLLKDMSAKLVMLQEEDGLWRPSLLDPDEFPMPESSGTGFFCYALAWGINNGILDRATYLQPVKKAWAGLLWALDEDGKLGHVQKVAGSPGAVRPEDTHEYASGAFLLAGSEVLKLNRFNFDFGGGRVEPGMLRIDKDTTYTAARGYGWMPGAEIEDRDRSGADLMRRDFAFSKAPAIFQVDVDPGWYRVALISGDLLHADHVLQPRINGQALQEMAPAKGEFITQSADVLLTGALELALTSSASNWVLNGLTIEPIEKRDGAAGESIKTVISKSRIDAAQPRKPRDTWGDVLSWPDPIAPYVEQFRKNLKGAKLEKPTGLTRKNYLPLIEGNVDFFRQHQDANGAIIDPYRKVEFQYSTPCFAYAAAMVINEKNRKDLVEPAAKAMDWSCDRLKQRKGATAHEDFYPPNLAHALPLLKPHVPAERYEKWIKDLKSFDPHDVYRSAPGSGNWNVVALSGEYLFHKLGIRADLNYVESSLGAQGKWWHIPWGMYCEGPMAYDHFPRLWAADLLAAGYKGKNADKLAEVLHRAALTSLFMQSPWGELPTGGRSAHHQWNEAEQCVTYEIYAAQALAAGDEEMAGVWKRAAHLALASMKRWVRPSGEMWIVKNRVDPAEQHGYEGYSAHSQYNLLPMGMLSIAYEHAKATEAVAERPAPADLGGFVLFIEQVFHKVFANAGGTYIELDTSADHAHNPTGLLRVHQKGVNPQIGPSDGLTPKAHYAHDKPSTFSAVGIAWKDMAGNWKRLAEYGGGTISDSSVFVEEQQPGRVAFQVLYQGYFSGSSVISERYVVTSGRVEITAQPGDYNGPIQMTFPVLVDDGERKCEIKTEGESVSVSLENSTQTFTAPGASSVELIDGRFHGRNGWYSAGVAEFPAGVPARLIISGSADEAH